MLDCNTLVFASLSQTTLLRSYTIDTMNDNTNILLGGGELLLTHTEDEARFQITPGSYLRSPTSYPTTARCESGVVGGGGDATLSRYRRLPPLAEQRRPM